jgi:endonuclease/exonuclease/phosphatase family metal-dependent hydrolase
MRTVVALLVCCLALVDLAGAADALPAPIRVMTFNLRYGTADDGQNSWERRRELVAAVIEDFAPDILGTQECLAFQRDFLQQGRIDHQVIAAGRDDGGEEGEMCALFVDGRRFAVLDAGHFWLSETPEVVGSRGWDAALPRLATWARLADALAGGRELLVVNTHWDHVGEQARRESARLLRARAAALAPGAPVLVMGDFNTPIDAGGPDDPGRLLREGGGDGLPPLLDTFAAAAAPVAGTYHAFTGSPQPGRIDAILATGQFSILAAAVVDTSAGGLFPSDHFPVTAVVRLDR